jgi:phospholipase C
VAAAAQSNPDVSVDYDPANKQLVVTLTNGGARPATFSLVPNAYTQAAVADVTVVARSQTRLNWLVSTTGGWYDFSVMVKGAPEYVRRLAGRLETGSASVSDPAMASQL